MALRGFDQKGVGPSDPRRPTEVRWAAGGCAPLRLCACSGGRACSCGSLPSDSPACHRCRCGHLPTPQGGGEGSPRPLPRRDALGGDLMCSLCAALNFQLPFDSTRAVRRTRRMPLLPLPARSRCRWQPLLAAAAAFSMCRTAVHPRPSLNASLTITHPSTPSPPGRHSRPPVHQRRQPGGAVWGRPALAGRGPRLHHQLPLERGACREGAHGWRVGGVCQRPPVQALALPPCLPPPTYRPRTSLPGRARAWCGPPPSADWSSTSARCWRGSSTTGRA